MRLLSGVLCGVVVVTTSVAVETTSLDVGIGRHVSDQGDSHMRSKNFYISSLGEDRVGEKDSDLERMKYTRR